MARIRTIKPSFFTSLSNSRLTLAQRLTYIALLTHCDDAGRCIDSAHVIRGAIWSLPVPETYGEEGRERIVAEVEDDLAVLAKEDKIIRYQRGDHPLLQVTNWRDHQVISRPSKSKYQPPDGYDDRGNRIENTE